jgi:hypothetical protein
LRWRLLVARAVCFHELDELPGACAKMELHEMGLLRKRAV